MKKGKGRVIGWTIELAWSNGVVEKYGDVDDTCACSKTGSELCYNACGACNQTDNLLDFDTSTSNTYPSTFANVSFTDCANDCAGVLQGSSKLYYYYYDNDLDGVNGLNYGNICSTDGADNTTEVPGKTLINVRA